MPPPSEDENGALERARARLYQAAPAAPEPRQPLSVSGDRVLPHEWKEETPPPLMPQQKSRHMRFAGIFFGFAFIFFVISLGFAGYFFYYGGASYSTDKIVMDIKGPTSIAGGDIVPLALTITNTNPLPIDNATLEIEFPNGSRDAGDLTKEYSRYSEKITQIASGETITRSVKAVVFGGAGQTLQIPVTLSYNISGSSSAYTKKVTYPVTISSTPIEVSVSAPSEVVSGKPITFTLTVRSNTAVPLSNVVLAGAFPFGFVPTDSSMPLSNSAFLLGTLAPGANKVITLTGTLTGQDSEQRVFRFAIGTANSANDQALAVTYMAQDASVALAAPFITTNISINGGSSSDVVSAGTRQNVTVTYANTLPTKVSNVNVAVTISGSAVDYSSIQTTRGFYRSLDRTVVFSQDTDPSLASMAPGASGTGTFTFSTLGAGSLGSSPKITFTTSISGTRTGQSNVPETINASATKEVRVMTAVALSTASLHASGPLGNSGPIPPVANQSTSYSVVWNLRNSGSTVADGIVSSTLPSYVSYTGKTAGSGSFSYDPTSRKVSWKVGDLAQGATAQGMFQVTLTPSTSQKGNAPKLTGAVNFSGYDRFASVSVSATAEAVTTETTGDPGYVSSNGIVQ